MRAIKLQTRVPHDKMLSIKLPDDVEEGLAEVIVLVPEAKRSAHGLSLRDFLSELSRRPHQIRSKEEIDERLRVERESWD